MELAVLFDLDDTLIDWRNSTGEWPSYIRPHVRKLFDYLSPRHPHLVWDTFALETLAVHADAWQDPIVSVGLAELLRGALQRLGVEEIDDEDLLRAYDWAPVPGVTAFPEAAPTLRTLREHGVRTGLVTNSPQPMWMRDIELGAFDLLGYFPDCRLTAGDVGYYKPHRRIYEAALELLGAAPEQTVFVGDNLDTDVRGANEIGTRSVLLISERTPPAEAWPAEPHATIGVLSDLPGVLDEWFPGWRKEDRNRRRRGLALRRGAIGGRRR